LAASTARSEAATISGSRSGSKKPPPPVTVLWSEDVPETPLGIPLASLATETKIAFRTADARGRAMSTATTVLVPRSPWRGAGARPLVSYQTAEDSLGTACSPSSALEGGLAATTSNAELETTDMAALVAKGWAVVTTDYEGPDSAFLTGPQEGYAVLDGIRAALAVHPHGLSAHAPIAMWGYSGGAFASAWAMTLLPRHSPRLHIAAVALGDMPSDLETAMRTVDGAYGFGLAFGGIVGIARGDPSAGISGIFSARGRAAVAQSADDCTVSLVARYAYDRLSEFTTSSKPYDLPVLHRALAANSLFSLRTAAPIYDYHTTSDEIVPVAVANAFVARSCAAGDRIQVVRTPLNTHITEQLVGAPGAMQFLAQRFGQAPVINSCHR
jgi:hypothetical protein